MAHFNLWRLAFAEIPLKKIVFVISDMGMGGAQRVTSLLAAALVQQSYHVHIVTMDDYKEASFFALPPSLPVHPLAATGKSNNIFSTIYFNIRRIKLLRSVLKNIKPDCVISFQTETNCTCLLAGIGTKIPVVISERSDPYIHPHSRIWRIMRRIVYPLANGAVFQTAHAERFFKNIVQSSVIIFNPVHIHEDGLADIPADPYILGVGRLSPEKGFDDLIIAHMIAQKKYSDLKLVLVGDGPERERLKILARSLGTTDHVFFAGAQNKLASYYNSALAFVLPSRFEGLPNALLESMFNGCLSISTPLFAAAPEIIQHGHDGLISASGAPDALAAEIIDVYNDPHKADILRKNAKISAKRFATDKICDAWINYMGKFIR
jgi:GalNAc-alpha-(1->4)-GalNAc-alpha-(1->3)-diNAcBac-PP-undecaprenol alpha-1,4-N-acetyl-D-galactosaminyltransferase